MLNKVESEKIAAIERITGNAVENESNAPRETLKCSLDHPHSQDALEATEATFDDLSRSLLGQLKMAGFDSQEQAAQK